MAPIGGRPMNEAGHDGCLRAAEFAKGEVAWTCSFAFLLWLRQRAARAVWPGNLSRLKTWITENGGDRIRTCDLEVMSLASYLAAPPRVSFLLPAGSSTGGTSIISGWTPFGQVRSCSQ
jgi:hypothetical protein